MSLDKPSNTIYSTAKNYLALKRENFSVHRDYLVGKRDPEYAALCEILSYTHDELVYILEHNSHRTFDTASTKFFEYFATIRKMAHSEQGEFSQSNDYMLKIVTKKTLDLYHVLTHIARKETQLKENLIRNMTQQSRKQVSITQYGHIHGMRNLSLADRAAYLSAVPETSYSTVIDEQYDALLALEDSIDPSYHTVDMDIVFKHQRNNFQVGLLAKHYYEGIANGYEMITFKPKPPHLVALTLVDDRLSAEHPCEIAVSDTPANKIYW